ncbi:MAG: 3-hydroxyacyl-CoA dehydrogenase NAD-binding domain-containing protein [Planococcus sp. (in: firmicutes)]|uniref:3-hydroxyacyl-CoA dehydrogenase NAD-binding domain-containing protein n=1 Tax=Planococcus halocryophilus TaxID=1215089 RepID=UPI001F0E7D47|nr:3-hydroxyacyl-CoA dehydrogenase NAD-binding domain-containing protein [Planococcus halocryophilus]MCH4826033.1 3-hydroxyacyl-CoA dehydrogenase NAD-binding domain-containing protein [Planococcus halocryophilus]
MKSIAIVGAGIMGNGIAQVAAESDFDVFLYDVDAVGLERGVSRIEKTLARNVEKTKIDQSQSDEIRRRITPTRNINDLKDVDLVIEAIIEQIEPKKSLLAELDNICKPSTIFASNTSGLSITEMASSVKRSGKVIGMHFFNPVPVMQLVEIIRGEQTTDETFELAHQVAERFNKVAISVKEAPLFAVNRILTPMINEAIFVLSEGIASAEDIDRGMMLGASHPIGPLALTDLIGLDTMLFVAETLYNETNDSKYRPAPLLKKYVRAGRLGRKSGQGFFTYD